MSGEYDGYWQQQRDEHAGTNGVGAKRVIPYLLNLTTGLPEAQTTQGLVPTDAYSISDTDEAATSPRYYGYLDKDGGWYIMKQTISSGVSTFRYVKGSSGYDFSTRAGLTYLSFDSAF